MLKTVALLLLRALMAFSPAVLSVAGLIFLAEPVPSWFWVLISVAAILSAWAAANSTDTPSAWLWYGLKSVHPRGVAATTRAQHLVSRAQKSVCVLDTYWGSANQFRSAIQDALSRSTSVTVQILIAADDGCISMIRDAAMPNEVNVRSNLAACLENINGMRRQVEQHTPGSAARIEVRRYDAVVMGPLMIIDRKHVIAGTFLQSAGSPMTPAFEFVRRRFGSSEVIDHFVETFERIWVQAAKQSGS